MCSHNNKEETDLYVLTLLGDLRLCCSMRIPEHLQIIASGCQLTLIAGQISLQGRIIRLCQFVLCEQNLQQQRTDR